jgi:hypothetical protein
VTLAPPVEATVAPGATITSALWNTGVRDGVNFLANKPILFVTQTTTQNLTSSTWTALNFDTTVVDTYGGHSNVTNNSRYVAQQPGYYLVGGAACTAANTTGQRGGCVAKNGTRVQGGGALIQATSALSATVPTGFVPVFLNGTGDYVEIHAYQNGANPLATAASSDLDSSMIVFWLHA